MEFLKNEIKSAIDLFLRQLTSDKENTLKHGLHHYYPTGKYDKCRFVCNIECLYALLVSLNTDCRYYECTDAEQEAIHQLPAMQLNAASQIHSVGNSF